MICFLAKNCTRVLDSNIDEARLRYARERDDFHSFFPNQTSLGLRDMLRGQQRSETRRELVYWLFIAQQESAHDLWALLLVQACEAKLVDRRMAISNAPDTQLDHLVFDTFVDALNDLPLHLAAEDLQAHVLRVSNRALTKALRREHGETRATRERAAHQATRARRAFRHTPVAVLEAAE